eukprot:CAMPEP_0194695300 /NCGR_PEP_ID=MMETSP0295-20121207/21861_1 /TAXON_ID=39354 /ORGANISM="Heterosigma akashiwo, Strain CCMP2393" /LENGTH=109 /DNA_ID=CAMNT_0039586979 /DNA_START=45 /DNA_END=371 /DNA_ORIENTATION=+
MVDSGELSSTVEAALQHTEKPESRKLMAQLMKIVGVAGKTIRGSDFERILNAPRLKALSDRYGAATHFITIVPPTQNNLCLLRLALIKPNEWNSPTQDAIGNPSFTWND